MNEDEHCQDLRLLEVVVDTAHSGGPRRTVGYQENFCCLERESVAVIADQVKAFSLGRRGLVQNMPTEVAKDVLLRGH